MSRLFAPPKSVFGRFQAAQESDTDSSIGDADSIQTDKDTNDSVLRRKLYGVSAFLTQIVKKASPNEILSVSPVGLPRPPSFPPPVDAQYNTQNPPPAFTAANAKHFLAQLPQEIYQSSEFDLGLHALTELTQKSACFSDETINEMVRGYERGLDLLNGQLCEAVIKNSDSFVSAMTQIQTLETDVIMTCVLCRNGRRALQSAQSDLTVGGLQILSDYKSKQRSQDLIESLGTLTKLRETEAALGSALDRMNCLRAVRCSVRLTSLTPQQGLVLTQPIWDRARVHQSTLHNLMTEQMVTVLSNPEFNASLWEKLVRCYMFLRMPDEMLACLKQTYRSITFKSAAVNLSVLVQPNANQTLHNYTDNQVWLRALGRCVNDSNLSPSITCVISSCAHLMGQYALCVRATVALANRARDNNNTKLEFDDTDSSKSESDSGSPPSSPRSNPNPNSNSNNSGLVRLPTDDSVGSFGRKSTRSSAKQRVWHSEEERGCLLSLRPSCLAALIGLRTVLWDNVQAALICVLEEAKLPAFKVEGYLEFLDSINDFVRFGKLFCATDKSAQPPGALETTVATKTKSMYIQWHRDNIDLLRGVIDNEQWTQCPLPHAFKFKDLKEMRSERQATAHSARRWPYDVVQTITDCDHPEGALCAFASAFEESGSPWNSFMDLMSEGTARHNTFSDNGNPFNVEPSAAPPSPQDVADVSVCNITSGASLNAVKFFGRYTQIMEAVPVVSDTCFECVKEVANSYVSAVFTIFVSDVLASPAAPEPTQPLTDRARVTASVKKGMRGMTEGMKGMTGAVITGMNIASKSLTSKQQQQQQQQSQQTGAALAAAIHHASEVWSGSHSLSLKIPEEVVCDEGFSPHPCLSSPQQGLGLAQAAIAASSLTFIQQAISALTPRIESLLPGKLRGSCLAFEEEMVAKTKGVIDLVYDALAIRLVNMATHCASILAVNWGDVKESSLDQSNKYIEELLLELRDLKRRIDASSLPSACVDQVWQHVMSYVMECLVDSFARVKKCSTGGRALMSLDIQMLRSGLRNNILPASASPDWKYVENYIKAHYLIEQELMNWIQNHPEYRLQHVHALINNLPLNIKRKARNELIAQATAIHGGTNALEHIEADPNP